MSATDNALPPRMARTYSGFWPWRLLCKRRSLRKRRPPAGQEGLRTGCLEWQIESSDFLGNISSWSLARARSIEGWIFYWSIKGSQEKTGLTSETSTNDEVKPDAEKSLEEVVAE
jgi:hypothetical protein